MSEGIGVLILWALMAFICATWARADAKSRNMDVGAWTAVTAFFTFAGVVVYLIARRGHEPAREP